MVDVMVMKEIKDTALHLGVDLSTLDLDAIRLPPGEKCGIVRSLRSSKKWSLDGLWMPVDPETEKTLGYYFIEYNTPQVPNEWAPPETKPYAPGVRTLYLIDISDALWCWYLLQENLQHWLTDAKARDQFVIHAGSDTKFWTESFVQWSPLGTYLATVHTQGAAV
ncbi:Eukaryotic translation initiation factor 3 subunit B [Glycine soja]|uniref:Eukaryotic translation initiation factor 3 subunit B n=1 Tax=Glycine soja TaxID=3848 RepID=A0A445M283_GLYSO|nr:Eukaryotic translation initiation factor 3 subunit B [Glycine soja]